MKEKRGKQGITSNNKCANLNRVRKHKFGISSKHVKKHFRSHKNAIVVHSLKASAPSSVTLPHSGKGNNWANLTLLILTAAWGATCVAPCVPLDAVEHEMKLLQEMIAEVWEWERGKAKVEAGGDYDYLCCWLGGELKNRCCQLASTRGRQSCVFTGSKATRGRGQDIGGNCNRTRRRQWAH